MISNEFRNSGKLAMRFGDAHSTNSGSVVKARSLNKSRDVISARSFWSKFAKRFSGVSAQPFV
jgi:hypothetical protein